MSALPSGTVTFLFTDIQGSTRKWQDHPSQMKKALPRHDEILRQAIKSNGGYVFKTVGDAFCSAFDTAIEGFLAALQAQLRLARERWDPLVPIRCRMGIHTGEAVERDGDYYGPAVNRTARIESIGHGGQTLVSLVTCELIRDTLPVQVTLSDLGQVRLKDLTRAENVFQLIHPDLPSSFPPLDSLDRRKHNLPIQPSPLVGREAEFQRASELISTQGVRVVTLTGPGGIGKTRLSMQIGADLVNRFSDGVFFVDLSGARTENELIANVARVFRITEAPGRELAEDLADYLRTRQLLLILDNLEQIAEPLVRTVEFVTKCDHLRVLATSRQPLHVRVERVLSVSPLSVPDRRLFVSADLSSISHYESVQLFIERAKAIDDGFSVTSTNAPAIAELCAKLDGIPLALELAAARVNFLSPGEILSRLQTALSVLSHGAYDLPIRQRTLTTTIDWSYDLLDEGHQWLFAALSVFRSGFRIDTAESVLRELRPELDVLEGVSSLLEKSLLIRHHAVRSEQRIGMLETIRLYANEKREGLHEAEMISAGHAEFFLEYVCRRREEVEGENQQRAMEELDIELENLRLALNHFATTDQSQFMTMFSSIWRYLRYRGRYDEVIALTDVISRDRLPGEHRAVILLARGVVHRSRGRFSESLSELQHGLRVAYEESLDSVLSELLYELGWTCVFLNRLRHADFAFKKSAESASERSDRVRHALALHGQGGVALQRGDIDAAKEANGNALKIFGELGLKRQQALALGNLGVACHMAGEADMALELWTRAERIAAEIDERDQRKTFLNNIADQQLRRDDFEEAAERYGQLRVLSEETGDLLSFSRANNGLSECELKRGNTDIAYRYAQEARIHLEALDVTADYGVNLRIIGDIHNARSHVSEAKRLYEKSVQVLETLDDTEELAKARRRLENA